MAAASADQSVRIGPKAYVPELDGLRALSILPVMLYHCWLYTGSTAVGTAISQVASKGWAGVDVFFVISGYLITGILLDSRDRPDRWRNFYIRRSLRIFPLYYACMTALVVAALAIRWLELPIRDPNLDHIDRIWWNYLYLSNFARTFFGADRLPLDISWSLAVEEQFYLVYPFVVFAVSEARLRRILIGAVVAAAAFRWATFVWSGGHFLGPYVLPFCRMDQLALGGLACLLLREGNERAIRRVVTVAPFAVAAAAICHSLYGRGDLEFVILGYFLTAAAASSAIVVLMTGRWRLFAALLRWRPVVFVGRVSYGLYLLHLFARAAVQNGPWGPWLGYETLPAALLRLFIILALALAAAAASWTFFERPILALKQRYAPARLERAA